MKISTCGSSISKRTYTEIREAILSGRFHPEEKLNISLLSKKLNVSLGAVREALAQLSVEGFVKSSSHRGFSVAGVSAKDLWDLTLTRIEIESLCIEEAIRHQSKAWSSEVETSLALLNKLDAMKQTGSVEHKEAHRNFHNALLSSCPRPRLLTIRQRLFDESERYRRINFIVAPGRKTHSEHQALAEAMLSGNVYRAQALATEHISKTTDLILAVMPGKDVLNAHLPEAGKSTAIHKE